MGIKDIQDSFGDSSPAKSSVTDQLSADKRKTAAAVLLFMVLIFMWIRVFKKKSVSKASASVETQLVSVSEKKEDKKPSLEVEYRVLPVVKGRNDELACDFFSSERTGRSGGAEVNMVVKASGKDSQDIRSQLDLQAIIRGESPQVFINGWLLSVDDVFAVEVGKGEKECIITEISDQAVTVICEGCELKLEFVGVDSFVN